MFRWSVFFLSLAVLVMAMAWISLRVLELESQRQAAAAEAVVQERLRLALWRMDALASALLIRENARPPWHYRPFYQPEGFTEPHATQVCNHPAFSYLWGRNDPFSSRKVSRSRTQSGFAAIRLFRTFV